MIINSIVGSLNKIPLTIVGVLIFQTSLTYLGGISIMIGILFFSSFLFLFLFPFSSFLVPLFRVSSRFSFLFFSFLLLFFRPSLVPSLIALLFTVLNQAFQEESFFHFTNTANGAKKKQKLPLIKILQKFDFFFFLYSYFLYSLFYVHSR